MARTQRFYRKNEAEVMRYLGLEPTPNSGSGWVVKEDGQSDNVIAQLKSTDKNSIQIKKADIETLEHNAAVSHKLPVFVIQFLQSDSVYLLVSPEALGDVAHYLAKGSVRESRVDFAQPAGGTESTARKVRKIKSSSGSRERFYEENKTKRIRSATDGYEDYC